MDDVRITIRAQASDADVEAGILAEVRRLLGLDLDLDGFYRMVEADPALGHV